MSRAKIFAEYLQEGRSQGNPAYEAAALLRQQDEMLTLQGKVLRQITEETEQLSALNQSLQEQCAKQEAVIKQCIEALEPHKSVALRWYTPVDAALAAAKEVL